MQSHGTIAITRTNNHKKSSEEASPKMDWLLRTIALRTIHQIGDSHALQHRWRELHPVHRNDGPSRAMKYEKIESDEGSDAQEGDQYEEYPLAS